MKALSFIMISCVALILTSCNTHKHSLSSPSDVNNSKVFFEPEQTACYLQGGPEGMLNDLYSTLLKTAPVTQECISGRALVRFNITKEGVIDPETIKVIVNKSVPEDYIEAAIEAIKGLGRFEPGKRNGTPLRTAYNLPILYPVPLHLINTPE